MTYDYMTFSGMGGLDPLSSFFFWHCLPFLDSFRSFIWGGSLVRISKGHGEVD